MTDESSDWPRVSVIIPVADDSDGLTSTLDTVVESTYPTDRLDALVVVDGEAERTRAIGREYEDAHDHVTLLVEDEFHTPAAARNVGIRNATGELLVFLEPNIRVPPSWIEHTVVAFQATDAVWMGLDVAINSQGQSSSALERFDRGEYFLIDFFVRNFNLVPTCSLVTTRDVFEEVGYFDPRLVAHDDLDLSQRMTEAEYGPVLCDDIAKQVPNCTAPTLVHPPLESVRARLERTWRMGRGVGQVHLYSGQFDSLLEFLKGRLTSGDEQVLINQPQRWRSTSRVERFGFNLLHRAREASWALGAIYQYALESTFWGRAGLQTDHEAAEFDGDLGHAPDSH